MVSTHPVPSSVGVFMSGEVREPIPRAAIEALIALGYDEPPQCEGLNLALDWRMTYPGAWPTAYEDLDGNQCFALLRGLILLERDVGWSGGSVDPAIWLAAYTCRTFPTRWRAVAVWVRQNATNPAVRNPRYPQAHLSREHFDAYLEHVRRRELAIKARVAREQAAAKVRRAERVENYLARLNARPDRTQARTADLSTLEALPELERLRIILRRDRHALDYYPATWSNISQSVLRALDTSELRLLLHRCRRRRSRTWRSARPQLRLALAARP